jgi:hypothetical protein
MTLQYIPSAAKLGKLELGCFRFLQFIGYRTKEFKISGFFRL